MYTIRRLIVLVILVTASTFAGPPFKTDDPQPVDFQHWEFYLASVQQFTKQESGATAPHIEINYGAAPGVQLHVVAPLAYVNTAAGTHYGYSDTELGLKYRFINETETLPQIGIFPLVEIPTGSADKQLGNGKIQAYVPLWIQKSWGKLTTYGGGGIWVNPGPGRQNWGFAGWEVQYDYSDLLTLGGEITSQTSPSQDAHSSAGVTVGGFLNFTSQHHILFSVGHSLTGEPTFSGYIGYQLTV
ncbi:MAG: hypothetical protein EHM64_00335 [Ignavibacteriae bacterium]|nr:MAG: hypothetical protein EHM64_00335 [Ignavibacteriota bacterium]